MRILEEAKLAPSAISTGDSTNYSRGSGPLNLSRPIQHRRVGSGQDRASRIGTGLAKPIVSNGNPQAFVNPSVQPRPGDIKNISPYRSGVGPPQMPPPHLR